MGGRKREGGFHPLKLMSMRGSLASTKLEMTTIIALVNAKPECSKEVSAVYMLSVGAFSDCLESQARPVKSATK